VGTAGCPVHARTWCPPAAGAAGGGGARRAAPAACASCDVRTELWRCLACGVESCGRAAAGHAAAHAAATGHAVALGWADLSVWCYACEAYLSAFDIAELAPAFSAAHLARFGERPPMPGAMREGAHPTAA
jgi:hypothetical protein